MDPRERRFGVFVLDGEVAAVEAHPHVIAKLRFRLAGAAAQELGQPRRAVGQEAPLEELDQLVARFDQAVGLGLDVQVHERAGLPPQLHQRFRDADDVADEPVPGGVRRVGHPRLVRQRGRGDAAVEIGRHQASQDLEQVERISHPLVVAPVRRVDGGLDGRAVEGAVREPVDERDVEPLAIEERAKLLESIALEQLTGVARGEPQAEAERGRR